MKQSTDKDGSWGRRQHQRDGMTFFIAFAAFKDFLENCGVEL
jgi:hypothetical protein